MRQTDKDVKLVDATDLGSADVLAASANTPSALVIGNGVIAKGGVKVADAGGGDNALSVSVIVNTTELPYGDETVFLAGNDQFDAYTYGMDTILNVSTASAEDYDEALGTDIEWIGSQRQKEFYNGTYIFDYLGVRYTLFVYKSSSKWRAHVSMCHIGDGKAPFCLTVREDEVDGWQYDGSKLYTALSDLLSGERAAYVKAIPYSDEGKAEIHPASVDIMYDGSDDDITFDTSSALVCAALGWRLPADKSAPVACATAMTPLYEEAGATFNADTGYYELNGITDIDEEEMRRIYYRTAHRIGYYAQCAFAGAGVRTNLPIAGIEVYAGGFNAVGLFCEEGAYHILEVVTVCNTNRNSDYAEQISLTNATGLFWRCAKLRKVIGNLALWNCSNTTNIFVGCSSLEEVLIRALHSNLSFADSPNISAASLAFAVSNATGSGFTITVHATTYAKLVDSGNTEYYTVYTNALAKNIAFASA